MPKYNFKCDRCEIVIEGIMSFEESKLGRSCPKCGDGIMERQFSPQGTVFQVRWGKPKVRQKVKRMQA